MNKNILFTGGGGSGNELIWQLLKKKYNLFFCDISVNNVNPIIPKKRVFRICKSDSINYLKELRKLCLKKKIDLVVPGIDEELPILSKNKKILPELFLPDYEMIKICNDKWKFYNFCLKNSINIARTSLAKNFNYTKHNKKIIFKPINGRGSKGLIISKNIDETFLIIKLLKKKKILNKYIIQDYLDGLEYTVTCSNLRGLEYIFPLQVNEKKGITIKATYTNDKKIIKEIQKLNKILNKQIIFNVQLIKKQNKFYVLEINPRISTTFCLFLKNKFDPFSPRKLKITNIKYKKIERFYKNFV